MRTKIIVSILLFTLITTLLVPASTLFAQGERTTVFRDLAFGDTKKQVRLTVLRDEFFTTPMVNLGTEAMSPEGDVDVQIESVKLDLVFFFNQEGLYRLDASGGSVPDGEFDSTLQTKLDVLEKTMKKRFGAPSFTQRQDPDDVAAGSFKTVAYWSGEELDGVREIWVGISGTESGYEPNLIIQNPERADAPSLEDESTAPKKRSVNDASKLF